MEARQYLNKNRRLDGAEQENVQSRLPIHALLKDRRHSQTTHIKGVQAAAHHHNREIMDTWVGTRHLRPLGFQWWDLTGLLQELTDRCFHNNMGLLLRWACFGQELAWRIRWVDTELRSHR